MRLTKKISIFLKHITQRIANKTFLLRKIKAQASEIYFLTNHDHLTGAANRSLFNEVAKKALMDAEQVQQKVAIMMIDLDRFKNINETLGHEAGDWLLKEVTQRFTAALRKSDMLARLGGDEFAIIAGEITDTMDAHHVAEKLLHALLAPFFLNKQKIHISASIGVAVYPDDGKDILNLIQNADFALHNAKETGKNGYITYSSTFTNIANKKFSIEKLLRKNLEENHFYLCYQPIFNLNDRSLYGVEALLRWHNTDGLVFTNEEVIPVAEESGLMVPIGAWIMEAAFKQYCAWKKFKDKKIKLSINVSPRQIEREDFFIKTQELLNKYHIDPNAIIFEITETAIVKNIDRVRDTLVKLRDLGCQIYIDDFGEGHSSLNLLRSLPLAGLKIDKSFVERLGQDSKNARLIQLIFSLAEYLNYIIVTEGLENEEQLQFVKSFANHQKGQGFYLQHPVTPEEIEKLL